MVSDAESALLAGRWGWVLGMVMVVSDYNDRVQQMEMLRAREASLKQLLDHFAGSLKAHLGLKSEYGLLQREVEANKKVYDLLLIRHKEAALRADMQISDVQIIEPAALPDVPVSPRLVLNGLVGVVAGILLGGLVAVFRQYMDRSVHDDRELETILGIPCLASVPEVRPQGDDGSRFAGDEPAPTRSRWCW
jgi:hypothetical protein